MQHPHRIPRGSAPGRGIAARAAHRREAQTDRDPDRDHHAADPPVPLLPSNHPPAYPRSVRHGPPVVPVNDG
ncbi:hypothetical protein GCM10010340_25200 [Streptomyces griseoloalbus]|nr:hypothetical protein GCM10010340_25200 [Streptomyces albaduncus]